MNKAYPATLLFTAFALVAFAGNSVLCRLALGQGSIDAVSFTAVRLVSGMLMLWVLLLLNGGARAGDGRGGWLGAAMLFTYAIAFSLAYLELTTATGALVLFGAVQLTIVGVSLASGHRPHRLEWIGVATAFTGFVYLVLPGVTAPPVFGVVMMALAGVAWGAYTLNGRDSRNPLAETARNFTRTLPFVALAVLAACWYYPLKLTITGTVLALLSGALASGVGYAVWYRALKGLSPTQAGATQLLVPVIAAFGGVVFVSEPLTPRLIAASLLILGGIGIDLVGRYRSVRATG